jgi:hypothetical protein
LSTHLRLGLPSGLFPSGFPTNMLHAFLVSIRAAGPADLSVRFILSEIDSELGPVEGPYP